MEWTSEDRSLFPPQSHALASLRTYRVRWLLRCRAVLCNTMLRLALRGQEEQRAIRKEALLMTQLKHPNIVLTMGVTVKEADEFDPQMLCIVTEFTSRGSLYDVLHDTTVKLDFARIMAFAIDAATGLLFLHRHPP